MMRVLRSPLFWLPFLVSLMVVCVFFGWELGFMTSILPSLPRPPATTTDIAFTIILGFLLSLTTGLGVWNAKMGSCPLSVKSATGIAGILGAVTLICPVCLILPASLVGVSFMLSIMAPFLPILRIVTIVLLVVSVWMLRPRQ